MTAPTLLAGEGIRFEARVSLANTPIAGIVLSGGTITHGALNSGENPTPTVARLELVSLDAAGYLSDTYPEMGWGDSIPSGFVEAYTDTYEGGSARIALGAPVRVAVTTPTGFIDEYVDDYVSGFESVRFVGTVAAIDYTPSVVAITAISDAERLTRMYLDPSSWPAEDERARVERIVTAAGVNVKVVGDSTANLTAEGANSQKASVWALLSKVAHDCDALLYTTLAGEVVYRTRSATGGRTLVDIDPISTPVGGLILTQEAGRVVNHLTVTFPLPDGSGTGEVVVEDATSIQRYGLRQESRSVDLDQASAEAYANRWLNLLKDPDWHMPNSVLRMSLTRKAASFPSNLAAVLECDLDDEIRLPQLLPGSPVPSYSSRILGWVEVLSRAEWAIEWTLDPYGWSAKRAGAGDDLLPPPPTGPSMNPIMYPHTSQGQFRVANYDSALTYTASPLGGSGGSATLDTATGVYTVTASPSSWSVATDIQGSQPGYMERRPYTYHTEDHGYWRETTVEINEDYPARLEQRDVIGDPCVNGECPPAWYCFLGNCRTMVNVYHCDYGGSLSGTTCIKRRTEVRREWVSNIVNVKDSTPEGYSDVNGEWVRYR